MAQPSSVNLVAHIFWDVNEPTLGKVYFAGQACGWINRAGTVWNYRNLDGHYLGTYVDLDRAVASLVVYAFSDGKRKR